MQLTPLHSVPKATTEQPTMALLEAVDTAALGDSVRQAQRAAYAAIAEIRFDGMQFRSDIGHRAVGPRPG